MMEISKVLRNWLINLFAYKSFGGHYFFNNPNFSSDYTISYKKGIFIKVAKLSADSRFLNGWIDRNQKLIVFFSPKVGSTTLSQAAYELNSLIGKHHPNYQPITTTLEEASVSGNFNWVEFQSFRKVLFMRNPYERFVSFFINKLVSPYLRTMRGEHTGKNFYLNMAYLKQHRSQKQIHEMSFESVLKQLHDIYITEKHRNWDPHLNQQVTEDFCEIALNDTEVYDLNLISKFLNSWHMMYGFPANNIHLNQSLSVKTPHQNAEKLKFSSLALLDVLPSKDSYFDKNLEKLLREIYQHDYAIFEHQTTKKTTF